MSVIKFKFYNFCQIYGLGKLKRLAKVFAYGCFSNVILLTNSSVIYNTRTQRDERVADTFTYIIFVIYH